MVDKPGHYWCRRASNAFAPIVEVGQCVPPSALLSSHVRSITYSQAAEPRVIWRNFIVAVWISIVWAGYQLAWLIRHAIAVNRFYSPFTPRVVFFPILLGGAQLILWQRVYRDRDRGARFAAGFLAAFFALQLVIMGFQASVQLKVTEPDVALFAYLALSHGLFAFRAA